MAIYPSKTKTQHGIGLIEVLIAAVVVAVGLMALGSLQGGLMTSSGESKARAEAIKLAEAKLEEYRNNIIKSSFDADLAIGNANDSVPGSNATFARSWGITDATFPNRKNIGVKVTWGAAGSDETVNMVSEIVWADPGKATDYATGGNGLSANGPSPNNNSSETPNEQFEPGTGTDLGDGSDLRKHVVDDYIYLLDSSGKAVIKFKGGIQLTIKGTVYHGSVGSGATPTISLTPTASYPVTFSDLAYCIFPVPNTTADYICYFGGACADGGAGCPNGTHTYEAVNGGWYGKVGLIETTNDNFQNKKVCFAEDIAGTGINTLTSTAREYVTRRMDANNNAIASEGINQSFVCQNFLIVDKKGSGYPCDEFSDFTLPSDSTKKLAIPSSSIQRVLTAGQNVVLAEDTSSCGNTGKYEISGTITGSYADQVKVLVGHNACLTSLSDNGVWSYHCSIETVETSLTVTAYGGGVAPATQTFASLSPTMTGATLVTAGDSSPPSISPPSSPPSGDSSLATPAPAWSSTSDPKALTWNTINGATAYKIYTCTELNNSAITPTCTLALTSTSSVNSYAPAPGNKDTICVQVIATDGTVDSAASSLMCIYRNGNTYTYE